MVLQVNRVTHPSHRKAVEYDITATGLTKTTRTTWSRDKHVATQLQSKIMCIARQQKWSREAREAAHDYIQALSSPRNLAADVDTAQHNASVVMTDEQMSIVQAGFALTCYVISLTRGNFILQGMQQPWFPQKRSEAIASYQAVHSDQPCSEIAS